MCVLDSKSKTHIMGGFVSLSLLLSKQLKVFNSFNLYFGFLRKKFRVSSEN